MKNNKGITLISLAITVIVLIILASVAINSEISNVRYTRFTNAKAQMEAVQAQTNLWYQKYKNAKDNLVIKNELEQYGEDVKSTDTKALETLSKVGYNSESFKFFSAKYLNEKFDLEGIDYDFLINIKEQQIVLVGGIYYDGKDYYTLNDFGLEYVTYNEDLTSNSPKILNSQYSKVDIIWLDKHDQVIYEPNTPNLESNMIPIKWDISGRNATETTVEDLDWYNYSEKKWANTKSNGTYFVWVPRYAYRITYYKDKNSFDNGEKPVGYWDGRGLVDTKGNELYGEDVELTGKTEQELKEIYEQNFSLKAEAKIKNYNGISYIIYPSFANKNESLNLEGFWIAKNQVTAINEQTTNNYIKKPYSNASAENKIGAVIYYLSY